ncbi:hypothetical protein DAPPUDRAFT_235268 [Daphnia pulex]|uniref:Uncharacterized protein n=1 Tax=Daphnia pulex TaxID=6669 RepID=E9FYM7_DAPPU|nr:hypothetical protein DAPPUDRAFT_235268 [Daphnia pulex]|eukprot:EFX87559.1 hypothetical protein DAPPUDRAFT_235268 [Daphnia pulex]
MNLIQQQQQGSSSSSTSSTGGEHQGAIENKMVESQPSCSRQSSQDDADSSCAVGVKQSPSGRPKFPTIPRTTQRRQRQDSRMKLSNFNPLPRSAVNKSTAAAAAAAATVQNHNNKSRCAETSAAAAAMGVVVVVVNRLTDPPPRLTPPPNHRGNERRKSKLKLWGFRDYVNFLLAPSCHEEKKKKKYERHPTPSLHTKRKKGQQMSDDGGMNPPINLPASLESLPRAEHFPTQRHRWNTNEK